jgi:putative sterol carrier protein
MSVSVLSIAAKLEASIGMAKIKRRLAHLLSIGEGYNGRVLIDLGPSGRLLVDHGEVSVPHGEKPAQTSLAIDLRDLDQFLGGQLTVQMLMMTKRLRIAGRMTDALHFARYLELEIFGRSALPA